MQDIPSFFIETFSSFENPHLRFAQLGYDKCAPSAAFAHYRDFYIIHIILSGAGSIKLGDKNYFLKAGDAYCVRPNELLFQTADSKDPWELFFFAFGGNMADSLFQKTVFNQSPYFTLRDDSIYPLVTKLLTEVQQDNSKQIYYFKNLFELLSYFETSVPNTAISKPQARKNSTKEIIEWVKDYINSNYDKPIKVTDIARQLNISRSHLYRIFKEENDVNIETYIRITRINQACHLLKTTNLSANVIASLVGYSYYPNFFKHFKEDIGTTPTKYRI